MDYWRHRRGLTRLLTCLSLVPVALLTLLPDDRVASQRCAVSWSLPTPGRVELLANVVLFVAPVLLAAIAFRRPLLALTAGSLVSAAIEVVQALVPAIGRSCDERLVVQPIGSLIGAVLAGLVLRRHARTSEPG